MFTNCIFSIVSVCVHTDVVMSIAVCKKIIAIY